MEQEKTIQLPLPMKDAVRFPVVADCLAATIKIDSAVYNRTDCDKIFAHEDGTQVCRSYENPALKWKSGCPLATNKIDIAEEKRKRVRVGQQKQRKKA